MENPKATDLGRRLLGEIHGRVGIFSSDSVNNGSFTPPFESEGNRPFSKTIGNSKFGVTAGYQKALGREALFAMYPDEIEYYAVSLEITDNKGVTEEFFSFPVMPNQIRMTHPYNGSIIKTMSGVVVNNTTTFVPFDIMISGNFGRKFRKNRPQTNKQEDTSSQSDATVTAKRNTFSSDFKTGYGNTKMLEKLFLKSRELDKYGRPYRLIFYNLAFNSIMLVEMMQPSFYQTSDVNGIWQYELSMKAVAPAYALFSKERLFNSMKDLLDFNRKNNELATQSEGLKSLLKPEGRNITRLRRIVERQIKSRALNAIGDQQESALVAMTQLTSNPNNIDEFIVNTSSNVLNTIQ